jgi:hypothetical protein
MSDDDKPKYPWEDEANKADALRPGAGRQPAREEL